jgi:hypothetical protein
MRGGRSGYGGDRMGRKENRRKINSKKNKKIGKG